MGHLKVILDNLPLELTLNLVFLSFTLVRMVGFVVLRIVRSLAY